MGELNSKSKYNGVPGESPPSPTLVVFANTNVCECVILTWGGIVWEGGRRAWRPQGHRGVMMGVGDSSALSTTESVETEVGVGRQDKRPDGAGWNVRHSIRETISSYELESFM